jgi:hypothetical protein
MKEFVILESTLLKREENRRKWKQMPSESLRQTTGNLITQKWAFIFVEETNFIDTDVELELKENEDITQTKNEAM